MKPIMKRFKTICLVVVAALFATSCEDMLIPESENITTNFGKDSLYSYWGIINSVQKVMAPTAAIGESRGDLVVPGEYASDSVSQIANFDNPANGTSGLVNLSAYYNAIYLCNYYINNVDTSRVLYSVKVMKKEYAQVQIIRAWLYMNLVNVYGSVPFITEPVEATNTKIENTAQRVDRTTLLDRLNEAGFQEALDLQEQYGKPNYGDYNTGAVTINGSLLALDGRLVAGDLYLMRGASVADYERAATEYFEYLTDNSPAASYYTTYNTSVFRNATYSGGQLTNVSYVPTYGSARSAYSSYATTVVNSLIPTAASSFFGDVVTNLANIYGFSTVTSNTTTALTDTTVSSAGNISTTATAKMRQLAPSPLFEQLAKSQSYFMVDPDNTNSTTTQYIEIEDLGDGRFGAASPTVRTDDDDLRFVGKIATTSTSTDIVSAYSFTFHYAFNTYRHTQVALRYAEAINRAGFPYYAFAILRNGLSSTQLPGALWRGYTTFPVDTIEVNGVDSVLYDSVMTYRYVKATTDNAIGYISYDEWVRAQAKPYLAFAQNTGVTIPPIHALGSGTVLPLLPDTMYSISGEVEKKYKQELSRVGTLTAVADTGRLVAYDEIIAEADPAMINLVEDLICDEMALELCYEGTRFFDLMRIAEHKNNDSNLAADFGTNWLAWKIARRGYTLAPYASPTVYDQTLYNKLLNKSNWFLPTPTYY